MPWWGCQRSLRPLHLQVQVCLQKDPRHNLSIWCNLNFIQADL